ATPLLRSGLCIKAQVDLLVLDRQLGRQVKVGAEVGWLLATPVAWVRCTRFQPGVEGKVDIGMDPQILVKRGRAAFRSADQEQVGPGGRAALLHHHRLNARGWSRFRGDGARSYAEGRM